MSAARISRTRTGTLNVAAPEAVASRAVRAKVHAEEAVFRPDRPSLWGTFEKKIVVGGAFSSPHRL